MDSATFDGHLHLCRRSAWGPVVNVRAPSLGAFDKVHPGVLKPAGGFHVSLNVRDSEGEQQVPDDLVTLQIYRCERQLSSTSWKETMASQRVSSIRRWFGIMTAGMDSFVPGRQHALDGPHVPQVEPTRVHQAVSCGRRPKFAFYEIACSNGITDILRSFVVALCFCGHVPGLIGVCDCTISRQICGLAKQNFLEKKRSNQKPPLTVHMVTAFGTFHSW